MNIQEIKINQMFTIKMIIIKILPQNNILQIIK